jgi:hypothetical protein
MTSVRRDTVLLSNNDKLQYAGARTQMSPALKLDVSLNYRPWTVAASCFKTHKKNDKRWIKIIVLKNISGIKCNDIPMRAK